MDPKPLNSRILQELAMRSQVHDDAIEAQGRGMSASTAASYCGHRRIRRGARRTYWVKDGSHETLIELCEYEEADSEETRGRQELIAFGFSPEGYNSEASSTPQPTAEYEDTRLRDAVFLAISIAWMWFLWTVLKYLYTTVTGWFS